MALVVGIVLPMHDAHDTTQSIRSVSEEQKRGNHGRRRYRTTSKHRGGAASGLQLLWDMDSPRLWTFARNLALEGSDADVRPSSILKRGRDMSQCVHSMCKGVPSASV